VHARRIAVLVITVLAGVTGVQAQPREETVTFVLNWTPVADHAPYFLARDLGWYKQRGINVKLEFGKGSADSARRVELGQGDLGVSDTGTVIVALGRGAKLKIVAMLFDRSPNTIWTRKDTGITKPKDLEGKSVGAPPGDAQRVLFPALAKANNVDVNRVSFVNIEPAAKYGALAQKRVDAIFDFYTGAPFVWKAIGKENSMAIPWADYGVDIYGLAIVVNDDFLRKKPDVVRRFLDASLKAWQATIRQPREAILVMKRNVPEIDEDSYLVNLDLGIQLFRTPRFATNGIGWVDPAKMKQTVDLVTTYIEVPNRVDYRSVFTNEYLTFYELPK